jgi:hypothetical protein
MAKFHEFARSIAAKLVLYFLEQSPKRAVVNVFVVRHATCLVESALAFVIRSRIFSGSTKNSESLQRFVTKHFVFFNFSF